MQDPEKDNIICNNTFEILYYTLTK